MENTRFDEHEDRETSSGQAKPKMGYRFFDSRIVPRDTQLKQSFADNSRTTLGSLLHLRGPSVSLPW